MRLAERRAMLFNPDFWRTLAPHLCPFTCSPLLEAIGHLAKVPLEHVEAQYCAYFRACFARQDHSIHPGNATVH